MSIQAYNIEIFSRDFENKDHFTGGAVSVKNDYLALSENSISVDGAANASGGDYIRITGFGRECFGIVQELVVGKTESAVRYKSFISVFDAQILFNTDLQGSATTLEDAIAQYITDGWISNADASQNIRGLRVETISSTTGWGFNITGDVEGIPKAIINFHGVLLQRALTKYNVGVYATPDFDAGTITLRVGVLDAQPVTVEADLPNIISKTIIVDQASFSANKAMVYDKADMITRAVYYLHPDGTVDQNNTDRITPVAYKMTAIEAEDFATAAAAEAASILSGAEKNLIEIGVINSDPLAGIEIGQGARIITGGRIISTVLTGKTTGDTTLLIFGAIRLELTTQLRQRGA